MEVPLDSNWPDEKEILKFPKWKLKAARAIFRTVDTFVLYTEIDDPRTDWTSYEGESVIRERVDQRFGSAVSIARSIVHSPVLDERTKGYQIVSILAIWHAWNAFHYFLMKDPELSNDPSIAPPGITNKWGNEKLIIAGNLFSAAQNWKSEKAQSVIKTEALNKGIQKGKKIGVSEINRSNAQKGRKRKLTKILEEIYLSLTDKSENPSNIAIFENLKNYSFPEDSGIYFDPADEDLIYVSNGTVTFSALEKRLTRIRENFGKK